MIFKAAIIIPINLMLMLVVSMSGLVDVNFFGLPISKIELTLL